MIGGVARRAVPGWSLFRSEDSPLIDYMTPAHWLATMASGEWYFIAVSQSITHQAGRLPEQLRVSKMR
jgi:uncharacterized protein YqcC (DUF446 family)